MIGGDRYRNMKKRYCNRQNVMPVFMTFAIPQLFLGLMFKHLTFSEKLLFVLAVPLRLFFEVVGLLAAVRCGDGVKILFDAFCLIKIPRVGCLVLQKHRGVLVAYCRRRFERLKTADSWAMTARIAIVTATCARSPSKRACSACSKCSTGDSDMNQFLALER